MLTSCSSTKFVDSWRNKEITSFSPKKLLVIGMTDNLTARNIFEEDLKKAFIFRNIYSVQSIHEFKNGFTKSKKSEKEIDEMIKQLAKNDYDAVIITAIKGVEERRSTYGDGYYTSGYRWSRFGYYYFRFQDIYYTPEYYDTYNVYHIETSIYNINEDENKSLVWVGALDIINPKTIATTVKDYVARIITELEREKLIKKL